jgi:hypothetical protein
MCLQRFSQRNTDRRGGAADQARECVAAVEEAASGGLRARVGQHVRKRGRQACAYKRADIVSLRQVHIGDGLAGKARSFGGELSQGDAFIAREFID